MSSITSALPLSTFEAYWHACTGTPYEPTFVPVRLDRDAPLDAVFLFAGRKKGETPEDWARRCGRIDHVAGAVPSLERMDDRDARIANYGINRDLWQRWYAEGVERALPVNKPPANPYYVKTHASAPGTVRSWFRTMRATDFARDAAKATSTEGGYFWKVNEQLQGWTLFDTLKVVDRVTAGTYSLTVPIEAQWPQEPDYVRRMKTFQKELRRNLVLGEWSTEP